MLKLSGKKSWIITLVIVAVLAVMPAFAKSYALYLIALVAAYWISAMGINILQGVCGQMCLAHHVFMGLGAYASAVLVMNLHIPIPFAIIIASVFSMAVSLVIALPALRLSGFELAIATLGFGAIFYRVVMKAVPLTGGPAGEAVNQLKIFGLKSSVSLYYVILIIAVLCFWFIGNILKGRVGRAWLSIRDSEVAGEAMGVSITKYKMIAFAACAFFGALGGAFEGQLLGYLSPDHYNTK